MKDSIGWLQKEPARLAAAIGVGFPNRETSVSEIVFGCALGAAETAANIRLEHDDFEDGFEVTSGVPLSDAGVVADRKAVNQYRDRFNQLFREKAEAEEKGDHERLDEIQDEMSQLAAAVSGAVGKGGKPRKLADKRKNVRDAFRRCGGVLRRNREREGTESGKAPETGPYGAVASAAAWPEPAPELGISDKKNQPRMVGFSNVGGEEEDRTPDLCIANAALSQLSYPPHHASDSSQREAPLAMRNGFPLR